jgi:hypothetical protein
MGILDILTISGKKFTELGKLSLRGRCSTSFVLDKKKIKILEKRIKIPS